MLQNELFVLVYRNLFINCFDAFLDCGVGWILEVVWSLIVAFDQCLDRLWLEIAPLVELQEVKANNLIEKFQQIPIVVEVDAVVELGKLEDDVQHFGLVRSRQTVVLLAKEDSLGALVHHLRTYRILMLI